jgi:hypothetical protein
MSKIPHTGPGCRSARIRPPLAFALSVSGSLPGCCVQVEQECSAEYARTCSGTLKEGRVLAALCVIARAPSQRRCVVDMLTVRLCST